MHTISDTVRAALAAPGCEPVLVLEITRDGDVRRFADAPSDDPAAETCLVTCTLPDDDAAGTLAGGQIHARLADPLGTIRAWLGDGDACGTVFQHFRGLAGTDLLPLAAGALATPRVWHERDGLLDLTLAPVTRFLRDSTVGEPATRARFPDMPAAREGAMPPIVFGAMQTVEAVPVSGGAQTTLALPFGAEDGACTVRSARDFPAGTCTIRVGNESLRGLFDGNVFTVTGRPVVASSAMLGSSDNLRVLVCPGLDSAAADAYAGMAARVVADGRTQLRRIIRSDAGALFLESPFTGESGDSELPPPGTVVAVTSFPTAHAAGERVTPAEGRFVVAAAGHACAAVHALEGWGRIVETALVNGRATKKTRTGRVPIPLDRAEVRLADAAFGGICTVTLTHAPSVMDPDVFLDDRVFVTLDGHAESGAPLANPARVLDRLVRAHGGAAAELWDGDAVETAATAREHVRCGFALTEPAALLALAADMAGQMAAALRWRNGRLTLTPLANALGEDAATFGPDLIEQDSVTRAAVSLDTRATETTVRFAQDGATAAITVRDENAAARIGRRARTIDGWMLADRASARWLAEFSVRHLRDLPEEVTFTAFHGALAVEAGDTIRLDRPDLFGGAVRGHVMRVERAPAAPRDGAPARVRLTVRVPVWEGCASGCEHACESGACESTGCELSCTAAAETGCAWACETSCESACELSCTTRAETRAGAMCASTAAESGCQSQCQSATAETVREIRQVRVVSAPTIHGSAGTAIQIDSEGRAFGDPFTVLDPFDLHPATDAEATAYLNFHDEWLFIPSRREVKLVRIISDLGSGAFSVREESRSGTSWGPSFTAWSVES